MEVFNHTRGGSNRDAVVAKEEGVATVAAEAEEETDAHPMRTDTHLEAFHNMSHR
jgi:hypothetical protein